MADRLDWKVSVTAVKEIAATGEALGASVLSADIKGSLGGGNSSGDWGGNDTTGWDAGTCTYITSDASTIAPGAGCDGVFIKHTGVDFSDGTTVSTATVSVSVAGPIQIAALQPGEAIFLPGMGNSTLTLGEGGGNAARVEYAVFT
mgnify:CR=1 FL=1